MAPDRWQTLTTACAAWLMAGGVTVAAGLARAAEAPPPAAAASAQSSRYHPVSLTGSAGTYYRSVWGVDNLRVQRAASGALIRFSYRVVDPVRAAVLGAERNIPYLIDPRRGVVLQVPKLEQVGDLRQRGQPVAGMTYWMAFSNKNQPVRAGDRVGVSIGTFHVDGMIVE